MKVFGGWKLIGFFLLPGLVWAGPSFSDEPDGIALRKWVTISVTRPRLNTQSGAYETTVKLVNSLKAKGVFYGPLTVLVASIKGPPVSLLNPSGVTAAGQPFQTISLAGAGFRPGMRLRTTLRFSNPANKPFKPRVAAFGLLAPKLPPLLDQSFRFVGPDGISWSDPGHESPAILWAPTGFPANSQAPQDEALARTALFVPNRPDNYVSGVLVLEANGNRWRDLLLVHSYSAPRIVSIPAVQAEVGRSFGYRPMIVDPDSNAWTWSLATGPDGMTVDPATGEVAWVPALGQSGQHNVTLSVEDGDHLKGNQTFVLTVPQPAPVAVTSTPPAEARVGQGYAYPIIATNADRPLGNLRYGVAAGPDGAVIDPVTGLLAWTPRADQVGRFGFTVRVDDPIGLGAAQSFEVAVRPPLSPQEILAGKMAAQGWMRLGMLGDSMTVAGQRGGGTRPEYFLGGRALTVWAAQLSGGCIAPILQEGYGGQRSDQIRRLASKVFEAPLDAVLVVAGTNDVGQDVPVATTMGHLNGIYDDLLAAGILPIAATIPPREGDGPARVDLEIELNRAIIANAAERKLPVVDLFAATASEVGYAWGNPAWHLPGDRIHWSQPGVIQAADPVANLCREIIPSSAPGAGVPLAPNQYAADLIANPLFLSGTGIPTGWTDWFLTDDISTVRKPSDDLDGVGLAGSGVWHVAVGSDGDTAYEMQGPRSFPLVAGHRYGFGFRMKLVRGGNDARTSWGGLTIRNAADVGKDILAGFFSGGTASDLLSADLPTISFYQEFICPQNVASGVLYMAAAGYGSIAQLANITLIDWTALGY